jgi:hypothetical protein
VVPSKMMDRGFAEYMSGISMFCNSNVNPPLLAYFRI